MWLAGRGYKPSVSNSNISVFRNQFKALQGYYLMCKPLLYRSTFILLSREFRLCICCIYLCGRDPKQNAFVGFGVHLREIINACGDFLQKLNIGVLFNTTFDDLVPFLRSQRNLRNKLYFPFFRCESTEYFSCLFSFITIVCDND